MNVIFSPTARLQILKEVAWWLEFGPTSPYAFVEELEQVLELLKQRPLVGAPYRGALRRKLMRSTGFYVYYRYFPVDSLLKIHEVRSCRRRRGPRL